MNSDNLLIVGGTGGTGVTGVSNEPAHLEVILLPLGQRLLGQGALNAILPKTAVAIIMRVQKVCIVSFGSWTVNFSRRGE